MLKRLFIILPLMILISLGLIILIIPLIYWVITGRDYMKVFDHF